MLRAVLFCMLLLQGCESLALSQVPDGAEEHPINTPEQSRRLIQEHTPTHQEWAPE